MSDDKLKKYDNFFVYLITNTENGKRYVGQHGCVGRIEDDNYLGSGKLLMLARRKYGKNSFIREVIEVCSEDDLNEKEIFWIAELKTHVSQGGYNVSWGGQGKWRRGVPLSKRSRKLISEKRKGKAPWNKGLTGVYDEKSLLKMSTTQKNRPPASVLTREKLSQVHLGKPKSSEHRANLAKSKLGDLNPAKASSSRESISRNRKGKTTGENNPMHGSRRTRESLLSKGIAIKGDVKEYLRSKVRCANLVTGEILMCDGVSEVMKTFGISRNKYYNAVDMDNAINDVVFKRI